MDDSPLDAREHFAEPLDVEQAGRGIGARRAQQHMVGLVLAQHVVDEIGRDRDLPPRSSPRPGKRRSIRPAMMAQLRKVRFISADSASHASRSSPSMSSSNSAASDSSPRRMRSADVAEPPDRERIFVGDEAERPQPRALQPPRQQHAERLVREPALERIADEIMLVAARKGLDQQVARARAAASAIAGCAAIRAPGRAAPPIAAARRGCGARARRDRSRAGTCRPRRTAPSGRSRWCARHRPRPRPAPRSAGSRRRTRRCRPAPASR